MNQVEAIQLCKQFSSDLISVKKLHNLMTSHLNFNYRGGVLTPAVAFAETSLLEELPKNKITFTVV